jgi:hypothetical protein
MERRIRMFLIQITWQDRCGNRHCCSAVYYNQKSIFYEQTKQHKKWRKIHMQKGGVIYNNNNIKEWKSEYTYTGDRVPPTSWVIRATGSSLLKAQSTPSGQRTRFVFSFRSSSIIFRYFSVLNHWCRCVDVHQLLTNVNCFIGCVVIGRLSFVFQPKKFILRPSKQ